MNPWQQGWITPQSKFAVPPTDVDFRKLLGSLWNGQAVPHGEQLVFTMARICSRGVGISNLRTKWIKMGHPRGFRNAAKTPLALVMIYPMLYFIYLLKTEKNHNKLLNFHEVPPLKVKVCPTVIVLYSCSWHVEASQNFRSQVLSSMAVQSTIPRRFPSARDDLWGFGWTMQEKPRCIPFCEHVTCWSYKLLKRNILLRPILFDDVWLYFTLLLAKSNVSLVSPILLDACPLVHVQTMTQNIHTLSQNSPKCPLTIIKVDAVSFRYLLHSCCLHPCCLDHDIDFYGYIILYN